MSRRRTRTCPPSSRAAAVTRRVEEVLELHTDLDPQQRRQAALVQPKIIVCLGRIAAKVIIKEDFNMRKGLSA